MALFDVSKPFELKTIDGKTCVVRFPSDQEWCDRARKHKTVARSLGRGKTQFDEARDAKQIDAELFAKIRIDKENAAVFDESEAAFIVDRLDRARLVSAERIGPHYKITLRVPGATTVHTLKIPSQRQVDEYTAAATSKVFGQRQTETRAFIDPAGPLYDALLQGQAEGYAGAVPITHKFGAVVILLSELALALDEDDPED